MRQGGRSTHPSSLAGSIGGPERSAFSDLVLAEADPAACLKYLNALVSPNPFDLEAVEPFIAFGHKRLRFVDGTEGLARLDSRRDLLTLSPTEFEHLVKDLFVAMGAEAWRTVPSKDGRTSEQFDQRSKSTWAWASSPTRRTTPRQSSPGPR